MPLGVLEMASLDGLPPSSSSKRKTSSDGTNQAPSDVSPRTLYCVFALMGAFLIISVVGAAVTFVETQARDATKSRNSTGPVPEYIMFAHNDVVEPQSGRRNSTSFQDLLDALRAGRTTAAPSTPLVLPSRRRAVWVVTLKSDERGQTD